MSQQTRYPKDGRVTITLTPEKKAPFTLNIRIPGWARNEPLPSDLYRYDDTLKPEVRISVNDQPVSFVVKRGFAEIKRIWQPGDTVTLELPMMVRRVVANPAVKADVDQFAIERGPVVYCAEGADNDGKVFSKMPGADAKYEVQDRPDLFGGIVTVKLVPQGQGDALTLIPYCFWENRGPNEMTVWFRTKPAPPDPWAVSYCHEGDSVEACFDGQVPKNSNDHSVPRMTWWDHKGTAEWVERSLDKQTRLSFAEVYWFDDTGKGGCRVPQSWRLLYKDGDQWRPVTTKSECGVKPNQFNRVTFEPVITTGLRLEVQLQPKFSGGILEWKMGE